jgi:hypothetical protein
MGEKLAKTRFVARNAISKIRGFRRQVVSKSDPRGSAIIASAADDCCIDSDRLRLAASRSACLAYTAG